MVKQDVELRRREVTVDDALPATLPPLLKRLYLQRGVRDAAELERGAKNLLPYQSLSGIESAVELLHQALLDGRRGSAHRSGGVVEQDLLLLDHAHHRAL